MVTFRWTETDPARPAYDVLVRMIALTDYAYEDGDLAPYLMDRQPDGSWSLDLHLPSDLRTGYQFCPVRDRPLRGHHPDEQRWLEILATGVPDQAPSAVVPDEIYGSTEPASVLELPDAPPQPWVARRPDVDPGELRRVELGTSVIYVWTPSAEPRATVISFDGSAFRERGIEVTFANLVADGAAPPFTGILIESIHGGARRGPDRVRGLTHPEEYAAVVLEDVLPWLGNDNPVVVAGQSLGAIAAAGLAAVAPDRINAVIGQSAALWWPGDDEGGLAGEDTFASFRPTPPRPVRFFLEAGSEEGELLDANRKFRDILTTAGYDLTYREYRGGHDYACWRGGLADGIVTLLGS